MKDLAGHTITYREYEMANKAKSYQKQAAGNTKLPQKRFFSHFYFSSTFKHALSIRGVCSVLSWAGTTQRQAGHIRTGLAFPYFRTPLLDGRATVGHHLARSAIIFQYITSQAQSSLDRPPFCVGLIVSLLLGRAGESLYRAAARPNALNADVEARCPASALSLDSTGYRQECYAARCRRKAGGRGQRMAPVTSYLALPDSLPARAIMLPAGRFGSNARRAA